MTNSGADNLRWFALQVRTRWENSTAVLLSGKGYQTLLPTYQAKKRWNGKVKQIERSAFSRLCVLPVRRFQASSDTCHARSDFGRRSRRVPFPVNDGEIAAIQTIVASGFQAEPWPYLEVGQKIRIEGDSLSGLEGISDPVQGK